MVMTNEEIGAAVREAVAGALGLSEDEVVPAVTILGDLGAESIDLLDILFRIERKSKIKVQAADLTAYVQGGIPDEEFADADGFITPAGLAQLKKAMPQVDTSQGKIEAAKVMVLFSVQNLTDLVARRAADRTG